MEPAAAARAIKAGLIEPHIFHAYRKVIFGDNGAVIVSSSGSSLMYSWLTGFPGLDVSILAWVVKKASLIQSKIRVPARMLLS
jgi:hypothetical protein